MGCCPLLPCRGLHHEEGEEELVPRTSPTTKSFNVVAVVVDKVAGKEAGCVASERDGWLEVMPRRGPRRLALPAPEVARRRRQWS
jgi:hypothetical protein